MEQPELEREARNLAKRVSAMESRLGLTVEAQPVASAIAVDAAAERDTTDIIPVLRRTGRSRNARA